MTSFTGPLPTVSPVGGVDVWGQIVVDRMTDLDNAFIGVVPASGAALNTLLIAAAAAGQPVVLRGGTTLTTTVPIDIPSNTTLNLNGATIRNGCAGTTDRLLNIVSRANVRIIGGILDGDKASFAGVTEQRHNLRIVNSTKIILMDLITMNAKGDGLYVGDDVTGPSADLRIVNVLASGNHRNGESISAASRVRHYGCRFTTSSGTSPQAGVDIEPNVTGAIIDDITFADCLFDANVWDGVIVQAVSATPAVRQGGVRFIDCSSRGNGTNGVQLRWAQDLSWVGGQVSTNAQKGVYFRDTINNVRFDCDVVANGNEGYSQPAGDITDLRIDGYIYGNGTAGAAGTYDGCNLAGTVTRLKFDATSGGVQQRYGLRTLSTSSQVTVGARARFPGNTTGTASLADDFSTRLVLASELGWKVGRPNATDVAFSTRQTGQTFDLFAFREDGRMQWGSGAAASDVTLERYGVGVVGVGALHVIRGGKGATGVRPSAVTAGSGASWFDTTLVKPIWSDGTVWRDSAGTAV